MLYEAAQVLLCQFQQLIGVKSTGKGIALPSHLAFCGGNVDVENDAYYTYSAVVPPVSRM